MNKIFISLSIDTTRPGGGPAEEGTTDSNTRPSGGLGECINAEI